MESDSLCKQQETKDNEAFTSCLKHKDEQRCFASVGEVDELKWPPIHQRNLTQNNDNFTQQHCCVNKTCTKTASLHYSKKLSQKNICYKASCDHETLFDHNFKKERKVAQPKLQDEMGLPQFEYWNSLSDEIILKIFSFLTQKELLVCTKVCHKWLRLAYDDIFWETVDLSEYTIGEDSLKILLKRRSKVVRLAWTKILSDDNENTETTENETRDNPELEYNVQYLDASSCDVAASVLFRILKRCRKMKKLSLESCELSTSLLRAIGNFPNLTILNLCLCRNITTKGLCVFSKNISRITELNLAWTNLTLEMVHQVVQSFPYLKKINLSGCRTSLDDEGVAKLLETCEKLTTLDLSDCIVITEDSIKKIIKHNRIEYLCLSRCYGLPPTSLELLCSLKCLKTLQIFGFLTNSGMKLLQDILPGVTLNDDKLSSISRPLHTPFNQTIWDMRCRTLDD